MWVSIDIEADGPCPHLYSMIEIGAVIINDDNTIGKRFHGRLCPISDIWDPEALAISGYSREETTAFMYPKMTMKLFNDWLQHNCGDKPRFLSDTSGFDWQFVNYYFHRFVGKNPFGYSSTGLTSFYKGCVHDLRKSFKHLRTTPHTHDPVDDAMGNAEAFIKIKRLYGIK
jgi:DNA polymerase III epsilon subunit-like protein